MSKNNVEESLARELLEVQRTLGWMDLVIGSITDAVYVTDSEARIIFANQYFSDLIGKPRIFLLGQYLADIFPVVLDRTSSDEMMHDPDDVSTLDDQNVGVYVWEHDGRTHVFKISSRRLATTSQAVYLAQDITREHELSRMKSSFIDLASHQLRTPMTAIMMYSHMLNDGYGGEIDARQKELTNNVMLASERMIRLINDILNITRIQNEGLEPKQQKVSLQAILNMIDMEVRSRIEQKKIKYTKTFADETLYVFGSNSSMHEILSNLVVNAIQYTPYNGEIHVKASRVEDNIIVSIKDTGIGIPQEYLPRIFDQFSRADNAFEVFNEGTGLGLYMVKILLARVGGSIACESTLNEGTTFTVTLPCVATN